MYQSETWLQTITCLNQFIDFWQLKCGRFNNSFTGSKQMLGYIFIRLKIPFSRKVGFSLRDYCAANIWICQITKPCKQFKKLPKNANINPMFSHYNSISQFQKISISKKLRLLLIDIYEIFPMQSSEFIKSMYFRSNLKKKLKQNSKEIYFFIQKWIFIDKKI